MQRNYEIAQYMLQAYVDTGKPLLISEVAKALNTNARKINDIVRDAYCDWDLTDIEVPVRESNYGTVRGFRMAPAVMPSRRRLLTLLRAALAGDRTSLGALSAPPVDGSEPFTVETERTVA